MVERIEGNGDHDSKRGKHFFDVRFDRSTRRAVVEFVHPYSHNLEKPDELIFARTVFSVEIGRPLYPGLKIIHEVNREVLPNVIVNLRRFREEHPDLSHEHALLLFHAINGLDQIINPEPDESLSK